MGVISIEDFDRQTMMKVSIPFACVLVIVLIAWVLILALRMNWRPIQSAKISIADTFKTSINSPLVTIILVLWYIFFITPFLISIAWGITVSVLIKPYILGIIIACICTFIILLLFTYMNYRARGYPKSKDLLFPVILMTIIAIGLAIACVYCSNTISWMGVSFVMLFPPLLYFGFVAVYQRRRLALSKTINADAIETDEQYREAINSNIKSKSISVLSIVSVVFVSIIFNGLYIVTFLIDKNQQQYHNATIATGCISFLIDLLLIIKYKFKEDGSNYGLVLFFTAIVKMAMVCFSGRFWFTGHGCVYTAITTYILIEFVQNINIFIYSDQTKVSLVSDEDPITILSTLNPDRVNVSVSELITNGIFVLVMTIAMVVEIVLMNKKDLEIVFYTLRQQDLVILLVATTLCLGIGYGSASAFNFNHGEWTIVSICGIIISLVAYILVTTIWPALNSTPTVKSCAFLIMFFFICACLFVMAKRNLDYEELFWDNVKECNTNGTENTVLISAIGAIVSLILLAVLPFTVKGCTMVPLGAVCLIAAFLLYISLLTTLHNSISIEFSAGLLFFIILPYILMCAGVCCLYSLFKWEVIGGIIIVVILVSLIIMGIVISHGNQGEMGIGTMLLIELPSILLLGGSIALVYLEIYTIPATVAALLAAIIFFAGFTYKYGFANDISPTRRSIWLWGFAILMVAVVVVVSIAHKSAFFALTIFLLTVFVCSLGVVLIYTVQKRMCDVLVFSDVFMPVMGYSNGQLKVIHLFDVALILSFLAPWAWGAFATVFFVEPQFGGLGLAASMIFIGFIVLYVLLDFDDRTMNAVDYAPLHVFKRAISEAVSNGRGGIARESFGFDGVNDPETAKEIINSEQNYNKAIAEFSMRLKAQLYISSEIEFKYAREYLIQKLKATIPTIAFLRRDDWNAVERNQIFAVYKIEKAKDPEATERREYDQLVADQEELRRRAIEARISQINKQPQGGEGGTISISGNAGFDAPIIDVDNPYADLDEMQTEFERRKQLEAAERERQRQLEINAINEENMRRQREIDELRRREDELREEEAMLSPQERRRREWEAGAAEREARHKAAMATQMELNRRLRQKRIMQMRADERERQRQLVEQQLRQAEEERRRKEEEKRRRAEEAERRKRELEERQRREEEEQKRREEEERRELQRRLEEERNRRSRETEEERRRRLQNMEEERRRRMQQLAMDDAAEEQRRRRYVSNTLLTDVYGMEQNFMNNHNKQEELRRLSQYKDTTYIRILKRCLANGTKFEDPDFHPRARIGERASLQLTNDFRRIDDQYPKRFTRIQSDSMQQGELGDCYFIAALSSMAAVDPVKILTLFEEPYINSAGMACVVFNYMGSRVSVVIDTLVAYKYNRPRFTKPNMDDSPYWAALVEKAYAKLNGSYSAIIGGNSHSMFYRLFGLFPTNIKLDKADGREMIESGELWRKIKGYYNSKCCLCCGSYGGSDTEKNANGIVKGHAYTILRVEEVNNLRMMQLRNTWGDTEWKGDYGDNSPLWTPALKQRLGYENKDNGIFWMTFEDFAKNFAHLSVGRIMDRFQRTVIRTSFVPGPSDGDSPCSEKGALALRQWLIRFTGPTKIYGIAEKSTAEGSMHVSMKQMKGEEKMDKIYVGDLHFQEAMHLDTEIDSWEWSVDQGFEKPWAFLTHRKRQSTKQDIYIQLYTDKSITVSEL